MSDPREVLAEARKRVLGTMICGEWDGRWQCQVCTARLDALIAAAKDVRELELLEAGDDANHGGTA